MVVPAGRQRMNARSNRLFIANHLGVAAILLHGHRLDIWVAQVLGIARWSLPLPLACSTRGREGLEPVTRGAIGRDRPDIVTDDPWALRRLCLGGHSRWPRALSNHPPRQAGDGLWETPPGDAEHLRKPDIESVTVQQYGGYTYTWFAINDLFERMFIRWRRAGTTTGWRESGRRWETTTARVGREGRGRPGRVRLVRRRRGRRPTRRGRCRGRRSPAGPTSGQRDVGVCRYNPADNTWQRLSKSNSQGDFPPLLDDTVHDLAVDSAGRVGSPPRPARWASIRKAARGAARGSPSRAWIWRRMRCTASASPGIRSGSAPGRTGYYAWLTQRSLPWQNYEPGTSTGSGPLVLTPSAVMVGANTGYMEGTTTPTGGMSWVYRPIPGNTSSIAYLGVRASSELIAGTHGSGVFFQEGAGWTRYSTTDGLPSNEVRSALQDRLGRRWVATAAGLALRDHAYWMIFMRGLEPGSRWPDRPGARRRGPHLDRDCGPGYQRLRPRRPGRNRLGQLHDRQRAALEHHQRVGDRPGWQGVGGNGHGVAWWTPTTGAWQRWSPGTAGAIPALAISIDPLGRVWAGTGAGLAVYEGMAWRMLRASESSLYNDRVTSVAGDADYLWALSAGWFSARNHTAGPAGDCMPQITSLSTPRRAGHPDHPHRQRFRCPRPLLQPGALPPAGRPAKRQCPHRGTVVTAKAGRAGDRGA